VKDTLKLPGGGNVTASIVDAANPVVFIRARDIGLAGTEIDEIDAGAEIKEKLEAVRGQAAVMIGLAQTPQEAAEISQAVPKIVFVSEAQTYRSVTGRVIQANEIDLVARFMSMGTLHKAYAVTGAICTAGAAHIGGTVVNEMIQDRRPNETVRIGHPGGIIEPVFHLAGDDRPLAGNADLPQRVVFAGQRRQAERRHA